MDDMVFHAEYHRGHDHRRKHRLVVEGQFSGLMV